MLLGRDRATQTSRPRCVSTATCARKRCIRRGCPERSGARGGFTVPEARCATLRASRDFVGFGRVWTEKALAGRAICRATVRNRAGFTASVLAVLALGIGATTAVFSAVDAAMLRRCRSRRPAQLVVLRGVSVPFDFGLRARPAGAAVPGTSTTRARCAKTFSQVAAYAAGGLNPAGPRGSRRVRVGVVTANFFETLGVLPIRGGGFTSMA